MAASLASFFGPPWSDGLTCGLSCSKKMTKAEFLKAALEKLAQAVQLLDSAGEELLADDALELTERVNLRIQAPLHVCTPQWPDEHGD